MPSRRCAFVCDRCKRPADVLYVQRGALCGPCRYPEAYRSAPPAAPVEQLEQLELPL
jgi:hypothetical protein